MQAILKFLALASTAVALAVPEANIEKRAATAYDSAVSMALEGCPV